VPSLETATKRPLAYVTDLHEFASAPERAVQVKPSELVITAVVVLVVVAATATKRPSP
jgi:hypothetical protein